MAVYVRFKNWQKYNGRPGVITPTWFRLNNSFLTDPKIFLLDNNEICAFIYLLCETSRSGGSGEIFINHEHARITSRVEHRVLNQTIKKLKSLQIIEVRTLRGCYANVDRECTTDITDRQTDITNMPSPQPLVAKFDFDALYQKYPRKEGKSRGITICKTQIKSEEDYAKLAKAITAYAEHVRKTCLDGKFIKHFSTFMAGWRDWLEVDTGKAVITSRPEPVVQRLGVGFSDYGDKK